MRDMVDDDLEMASGLLARTEPPDEDGEERPEPDAEEDAETDGERAEPPAEPPADARPDPPEELYPDELSPFHPSCCILSRSLFFLSSLTFLSLMTSSS
jgi:hypothetical protein